MVQIGPKKICHLRRSGTNRALVVISLVVEFSGRCRPRFQIESIIRTISKISWSEPVIKIVRRYLSFVNYLRTFFIMNSKNTMIVKDISAGLKMKV